MMTEFTPLASLGGGILIGVASVLLMGGFGRIIGGDRRFGRLSDANVARRLGGGGPASWQE
ncbi:MAG: hypothetical protein ACSHWY_12475 [Octadecabacter sp.]